MLLNKFLKKNRRLPADWGVNDSSRYIEGLFCCEIAWNPTILSLPAMPGIPVYVPISSPTVPGDSPMVRFANLYSRAPDFTIELLVFVRKKFMKFSLNDQVVLTLRQIPSITYNTKEHLAAEDITELEKMLEGPVLNWLSESPLLERLEKVSGTVLSDDELAYDVGMRLKKKITAAMIREARRRMNNEDRLRKEQFLATVHSMKDKLEKPSESPE